MCKCKTIILFCFMFVYFCPHQVWSMPASPDLTQVIQPNGTVVKVYLKGDEWNNWVETAKGYTIAPDSNGVWRYVIDYVGNTPILDATPAENPPPQKISPAIHPDRSKGQPASKTAPMSSSEPESGVRTEGLRQSVTGTFSGPILFILASFSDRDGTYSEGTWASFISGNIADFYDKASYGKVNITPAAETYGTANNGVVGWVNLGYAHPNTQDNTGTANQDLTKNAIIAADPYVNFAAYDTNSDGYVDASELAVVVIVAGYERAYSAAYTPSVWGHKWSLDSPPTVDGKIVGDWHGGLGGYAQFGEIHQSDASDMHQATMGIMVHELGHLIFALPDLYDTDYSSSGVGAWCVMSGGSWGKSTDDTYSGQTPVLPSAWIKYNLDWVDGTEITGTANVVGAGEGTATPANAAFRVSSSLANEYFLVENRRPVGYDRGLERYLPSNFGGLAIWHVDENQAGNSNDVHRLVDMEEASGTQMGTGPGSSTDLWYNGNATVFNDTSNPNSKLYSGWSSGVSVSNISTPGVTMTALIGKTVVKTPGLLWNQPPSTVNTSAYANQDFETVNDSYDILMADDFTASTPWKIEIISIKGESWNLGCNLSCATALHFMIYADNGGSPAGYPDTGMGAGGSAPVWSLSLAPGDSQVSLSEGTFGYLTNVTLTLASPLQLPPGTYWLLFYPAMEFSTCCQYGRTVSDTTNGSVAKVMNSGGGFGFPATWTSVQDAATFGLAQYDLSFSIYGQGIASSPAINLLLLGD